MAEKDAGFSLVEALVALAMFAGVFAAVQQGLRTGWTGTGAARMETAAVEHARALIARAGTEMPLAPGTASGSTADGFAWKLTIAPASSRAASDVQRSRGWQAYAVSATVEWRGSGGRAPRKVELETMKIGAPRA